MFSIHRFSCGKGLADTSLVLLWISIIVYMQDTFINFRFIKNDAFIWNHENPREGDLIAERAFRQDPLYIFSSNVVNFLEKRTGRYTIITSFFTFLAWNSLEIIFFKEEGTSILEHWNWYFIFFGYLTIWLAIIAMFLLYTSTIYSKRVGSVLTIDDTSLKSI